MSLKDVRRTHYQSSLVMAARELFGFLPFVNFGLYYDTVKERMEEQKEVNHRHK